MALAAIRLIWGFDTNRDCRHAGRIRILPRPVCGSDRSVSSEGQFRDPANSRDLPAGQVCVQVAEVFLELLQRFSLREVIRELLNSRATSRGLANGRNEQRS